MSDPIVSVKEGKLRGKIASDRYGGNYYSFQGIPYAKPPLGILRFKAPQPAEPWQGIKDATKQGEQCYSRHLIYRTMLGSEDCLTINVYTPELPDGTSKPFPVMVWVHGGGFVKGSSSTDLHGPDYLVAEGVVLVSFNYRLGALGFLSMDEPSLGVPGNAGLKDMVLALKWVQNNISQFCGDPGNVTIFGESAGGAAVSFLMLSPMAKGLFHKAIAQSGSALCSWSRGYRFAEELGKIIGIEGKSPKELLECLQDTPVEKLLQSQEKLPDHPECSIVRPFGVIVEKNSTEEKFLPDEPINIIKSGNYNQVPLMTGFTNREGILFGILKFMETNRIDVITDFEDAIPFLFNVKRGSPASLEAAKKIKTFYYGNEEPSSSNLDKYYLLEGDSQFVKEIDTTVKEIAKVSKFPVYYYRFSLESAVNLYKSISKNTNFGACHADDLGYLFKNDFTPPIQPNTIEDIGIKRIVKLWANFAKFGNPTPELDKLINKQWKPVEDGVVNFMDIGDNLTVGVDPEGLRMAFWDEICALID